MSQDLGFDVDQAKARALVDINFFAGLCMPTTFTFPFPNYYVQLFQFLSAAASMEDLHEVIRIALGLPRGFAKTTFLKILVVWLIVHDKFSFITIICATEPHAENFVGDVDGILCSPNISMLYGSWENRKITDNKGEKKAQFHGKVVIINGAGAGSSVRGLSTDMRRPQLIICDDAQTKECAESEAESKHFIEWLVGTLFKIVDPFKSMIWYVGNMYNQECALYRFKEHEDWLSLITGCILESGKSLWPELHPIESIMSSFYHDEKLNMADTWFAEMMNDPTAKGSALLNGPLPMFKFDGEIEPDTAFITIDPAGFRDGADDNVITGHQEINKKSYIAEMDGGKFDPKTVIHRSLSMASRIRATLIGVEDVGYQQTLAFWFKDVMDAEKISGITIIGLPVARTAKEARIRSYLKEMYAGEHYFLREMDRMKVTWQAASYRAGKKNNKDDWLDSPALGNVVRNKFRHLLQRPKSQDKNKDRLVMDNCPF